MKKQKPQAREERVSRASGGYESSRRGLPCPNRIIESITIWGQGPTEKAADDAFAEWLSRIMEQKAKAFVCDGYTCDESGLYKFDYAATSKKECREYTTEIHKIQYWKCIQTFDMGCYCVYYF